MPQTYHKPDWYPLDYRKPVIPVILQPMGCELRDELGRRYLAALNLVRRAQLHLHHAVTDTNIECATTELRRVETYRLDLLREINLHCESHGCATAGLEEICRQPVEAHTQAVA